MATDGYLGDIIPIIAIGISGVALVISAVLPPSLFHLGQTRSKNSEQIRIGRESWDRIECKSHDAKDCMYKNEKCQSSESGEKLKKALHSLGNEFNYFVYLVKNDEIRETFILKYYREEAGLHDIHYIAKRIEKRNPDNKFPEAKRILDLVKKYYELTGKPEEFKDQDSEIYP